MASSLASTLTPSRPFLTLDEVFIRKASPSRQARLRLTPLSKKACLINGIDPTVLQLRDFQSFIEPGLDPEIATMRFEVYSHTREKLMQLALEEHAKLQVKVNATHDSISTCDSSTNVSKTSLHRTEEDRLERVAKRQEKELRRMLAFETKSQEIKKKAKLKAEEQKQVSRCG